MTKYSKDSTNILLCYRKLKPLEMVCANKKKDIERYIINLKEKGIDIEGYIIANGLTVGGHYTKDYDLINDYHPSLDEFIHIKELLLNREKFLEYIKNAKNTKDIKKI